MYMSTVLLNFIVISQFI